MSNWLSVGEMLDNIQVGESAINMDSSLEIVDTGEGLKLYRKNKKESEDLVMSPRIMESKWMILQPKLMSFSEAMQAIVEGERVMWRSPEPGNSRFHIFHKDDEDSLTLMFTMKQLLEGYWMVAVNI